MNNLQHIAMIVSNNPRARAYLDIMVKNKILPSYAILLNENSISSSIPENKTSLFDNETNIEKVLLKNNINIIKLNTHTVNDPVCLHEISQMQQEFIIFAGNPGNILSPDCFKLNKKFIHIHPGKVPEYRGSTTFYYSILHENNISMTAIFMNEKIDNGDIIDEMTFELSDEMFFDKVNLDTVLEPYIRSLLLNKLLLGYVQNGCFTPRIQNDNNDAEHGGKRDYYIIHPLLRHISILKNDNNN